MRKNPRFKNIKIDEAAKMFEESFRYLKVVTISGVQFEPRFEKSPHTTQFGGYIDTETSHKFRAYCEALVRVGFMDASEVTT